MKKKDIFFSFSFFNSFFLYFFIFLFILYLLFPFFLSLEPPYAHQHILFRSFFSRLYSIEVYMNKYEYIYFFSSWPVRLYVAAELSGCFRKVNVEQKMSDKEWNRKCLIKKGMSRNKWIQLAFQNDQNRKCDDHGSTERKEREREKEGRGETGRLDEKGGKEEEGKGREE